MQHDNSVAIVQDRLFGLMKGAAVIALKHRSANPDASDRDVLIIAVEEIRRMLAKVVEDKAADS